MKTNMVSNRDPLENPNSVYSVGTSVAVTALEKKYSNYDNEVILFNVGTLLRNIGITKETTLDDLIVPFSMELPTLLNETTSLMNIVVGNRKPIIVLYAVDYPACILPEYLREETYDRKILYQCVKYLISHRNEFFGTKGVGSINNIPIHFHIIQSNTYPVYETLGRFVSSVTHHKKLILFSHYPIDYHISLQYPDTFLLESHTGVFRKPYQFGPKVFGERYADIPFYPITHVLLGDSKLIKPMLGIRQKNELIQIAKTEKWKIQSEFFIQKSIFKHFGTKVNI